MRVQPPSLAWLNPTPHFASVPGKTSLGQQVHSYSTQSLSEKENHMKTTPCIGPHISQNSFSNSHPLWHGWGIQREQNTTSSSQSALLYGNETTLNQRRWVGDLHIKGLTLLWMCLCCLRPEEVAKVLPHSGQAWARAPTCWERMCLWRLLGSVKTC